MTKEHLQKLANEGNFEQLFTLLDQCFAQNPRYEYSQLKQNILHELTQGRQPNPAQMQGLLVFLNANKELKEW